MRTRVTSDDAEPWTAVPNTTSGNEFVVGISQSGEGLPSGDEATDPPGTGGTAESTELPGSDQVGH